MSVHDSPHRKGAGVQRIARRLLLSAPPFQLIQDHGEQQYQASQNILIKRGNVEQVHHVLHGAHDQHSHDRAADRAHPAGKGDAPENAGRDHVEGESLRGIGLPAGHTGCEHDTGETCHEALQDVDDHLVAIDGDSLQPGRRFVASDGARISSERGPIEDEGEERHQEQGDPDRVGNPEQPAGA